MTAEPLLGFRWWHVEETPGGRAQLVSWIRHHPWSTGWNHASHDDRVGMHRTNVRDLASEMVAGKRRSPSWNCECGIYGWYRLDRARVGRWEWTIVDHKFPTVAGAFIAAGRILHHREERGFRCEFAMPVALVNLTPPPGQIGWDSGMARGWDLAHRLGLPMMPDQNFERRCQEWGELRSEETA